ncbi:MAG TPA: response regulator transcription factor [Pseudomonadota bacterium]|jgi:DNA-binding NarL/FixJ family response regulator|nr:response regulator transcription factor [Pseudomonadota bacterium]
MMRILIADDHVVVRSGLKRMFEAEFPGVALGEVSNCKDLLDKVKSARWDVVILDVAMGAENGLNALPKLKAACPTLPVIVLSMYGERQFITRALAEGASAYLTKEQAADEEIFRAIRTVCAGRRYLGEALAEQLADHLAQDRKGKLHEILSSRELEVFLLLAAAKSVSEIAEQLGLSVKTVSTYRTRILDKMSLTTNAEIIQYAVRNGLTS